MQATRGHWLDYDLDHEIVFKQKYNFSVDLIRRDIVDRMCHPAVAQVKPSVEAGFVL
jgi:hypothetical protein